MAIYLVTWDLNTEKPNYAQARSAFLTKLDKFTDQTRDTRLDTVRFVSTTRSANEVSEFLRAAMDDDDRIFVTSIGSRATRAGWLSKTVWEWIDART